MIFVSQVFANMKMIIIGGTVLSQQHRHSLVFIFPFLTAQQSQLLVCVESDSGSACLKIIGGVDRFIYIYFLGRLDDCLGE